MERKTLHLVYSRGLIQKWYVKRMRGMANNRTYEKMLTCWKGGFPQGHRKSASLWMLDLLPMRTRC